MTETNPSTLGTRMRELVTALRVSGIGYDETINTVRREYLLQTLQDCETRRSCRRCPNSSREYLLQTLQDCEGNQCMAARKLGMHRNTMSRDIRSLGIHKEEFTRRGEA